MIITQKKPMEELMAMVGDAKTVAIVGCNSCATACHTGGEPEVAALAKALEAAGKKVVGTTIADYCCMNPRCQGQDEAPRRGKAGLRDLYVLRRRRAVRRKNAPGIPTYPSNNTMYLGEAVRFGVWEEACHFCGDCVLGQTGGICPVTQCAKSLVNGPCGGQKNGKCEVNPENDCAWIKIYKRLGGDRPARQARPHPRGQGLREVQLSENDQLKGEEII